MTELTPDEREALHNLGDHADAQADELDTIQDGRQRDELARRRGCFAFPRPELAAGILAGSGAGIAAVLLKEEAIADLMATVTAEQRTADRFAYEINTPTKDELVDLVGDNLHDKVFDRATNSALSYPSDLYRQGLAEMTFWDLLFQNDFSGSDIDHAAVKDAFTREYGSVEGGELYATFTTEFPEPSGLSKLWAKGKKAATDHLAGAVDTWGGVLGEAHHSFNQNLYVVTVPPGTNITDADVQRYGSAVLPVANRSNTNVMLIDTPSQFRVLRELGAIVEPLKARLIGAGASKETVKKLAVQEVFWPTGDKDHNVTALTGMSLRRFGRFSNKLTDKTSVHAHRLTAEGNANAQHVELSKAMETLNAREQSFPAHVTFLPFSGSLTPSALREVEALKDNGLEVMLVPTEQYTRIADVQGDLYARARADNLSATDYLQTLVDLGGWKVANLNYQGDTLTSLDLAKVVRPEDSGLVYEQPMTLPITREQSRVIAVTLGDARALRSDITASLLQKNDHSSALERVTTALEGDQKPTAQDLLSLAKNERVDYLLIPDSSEVKTTLESYAGPSTGRDVQKFLTDQGVGSRILTADMLESIPAMERPAMETTAYKPASYTIPGIELNFADEATMLGSIAGTALVGTIIAGAAFRGVYRGAKALAKTALKSSTGGLVG